jgi:hypothetical protein
MVVKCAKCGSAEFLERRVGPIEDRTGQETPHYDPMFPHLNPATYEYVCVKCGEEINLP